MRTVDTDVVVLVTHFFPQTKLKQLWNGFGTGKTYKDIPIHDICSNLGENRCKAILLFHALSGCDVSSAMYGIGKKKAWFAWETMGNVITQVFITLQTNPTSFTIDSELMVVLQRYHIIQFDPKCECNLVNEARKIMFTNRLKPLESIPPTKHALFQHIKRSILIAYEWSHSLEKQTLNLSPSDYG